MSPSIDSDAQSNCSGGSRRLCCKPVCLPCRACGDGARGWREKGKSLGGRRAGPAASRSRGRRRAARSVSAPRSLHRDPRPSPGAPCSSAPGPRPPAPDPERAAARVRPAVEPRGAAGALAAARGSVWPEDRRGRKGKAGTHTRRGARALHTRSRAPPPRRVGGEFGPAARAPAPARSSSCAPAWAPPRRPSAPPAARLHCSPFARGKRQRPDNLQTVAQLVSTPEAPECCPGEVSFLRVPGPSSRDPLSGLELGGSESRMNPGGLSTLSLCPPCAGGRV